MPLRLPAACLPTYRSACLSAACLSACLSICCLPAACLAACLSAACAPAAFLPAACLPACCLSPVCAPAAGHGVSKKARRRAAKRQEEAGSQWEAGSTNGSTAGAPLQDESSLASLGGVSAGGGAGDDASVASTGRYITCELICWEGAHAAGAHVRGTLTVLGYCLKAPVRPAHCVSPLQQQLLVAPHTMIDRLLLLSLLLPLLLPATLSAALLSSVILSLCHSGVTLVTLPSHSHRRVPCAAVEAPRPLRRLGIRLRLGC